MLENHCGVAKNPFRRISSADPSSCESVQTWVVELTNPFWKNMCVNLDHEFPKGIGINPYKVSLSCHPPPMSSCHRSFCWKLSPLERQNLTVKKECDQIGEPFRFLISQLGAGFSDLREIQVNPQKRRNNNGEIYKRKLRETKMSYLFWLNHHLEKRSGRDHLFESQERPA